MLSCFIKDVFDRRIRTYLALKFWFFFSSQPPLYGVSFLLAFQWTIERENNALFQQEHIFPFANC